MTINLPQIISFLTSQSTAMDMPRPSVHPTPSLTKQLNHQQKYNKKNFEKLLCEMKQFFL